MYGYFGLVRIYPPNHDRQISEYITKDCVSNSIKGL